MNRTHYRRLLRRLDLAYGVGLLSWREYIRLLSNLAAEHGPVAEPLWHASRVAFGRLN